MHKRKLKKEVSWLLLLIVGVAFVSTFEYTSSRYVAKSESVNDVLAVPILSLSNNGVSYNIDGMLPGETREYDFAVSNIEEEQINEILLSYNFEVKLDSTIPLTVKIIDQNGEELAMTDGKSSTENMVYGVETTKNYKVRVIWNSQDNNYEYAGKSAKLNVNLRAVQVI